MSDHLTDTEALEHALVLAFQQWNARPTMLNLVNLKGAVEELYAALNDGDGGARG